MSHMLNETFWAKELGLQTIQLERKKEMFKDWNVIDLRTDRMKYENAAAGKENISGAYSYRKLTDKSSQPRKASNPERCGVRF